MVNFQFNQAFNLIFLQERFNQFLIVTWSQVMLKCPVKASKLCRNQTILPRNICMYLVRTKFLVQLAVNNPQNI